MNAEQREALIQSISKTSKLEKVNTYVLISQTGKDLVMNANQPVIQFENKTVKAIVVPDQKDEGARIFKLNDRKVKAFKAIEWGLNKDNAEQYQFDFKQSQDIEIYTGVKNDTVYMLILTTYDKADDFTVVVSTKKKEVKKTLKLIETQKTNWADRHLIENRVGADGSAGHFVSAMHLYNELKHKKEIGTLQESEEKTLRLLRNYVPYLRFKEQLFVLVFPNEEIKFDNFFTWNAIKFHLTNIIRMISPGVGKGLPQKPGFAVYIKDELRKHKLGKRYSLMLLRSGLFNAALKDITCKKRYLYNCVENPDTIGKWFDHQGKALPCDTTSIEYQNWLADRQNEYAPIKEKEERRRKRR